MTLCFWRVTFVLMSTRVFYLSPYHSWGDLHLMVLSGNTSDFNYQDTALFPLVTRLVSPVPPHRLLPSSQLNSSFVDPCPESQSTCRSHSQFHTLNLTCFSVPLTPQIWAMFWYSLLFATVIKHSGREQAFHQHFPTFLGSTVLRDRTQKWDGKDKAMHRVFA